MKTEFPHRTSNVPSCYRKRFESLFARVRGIKELELQSGCCGLGKNVIILTTLLLCINLPVEGKGLKSRLDLLDQLPHFSQGEVLVQKLSTKGFCKNQKPIGMKEYFSKLHRTPSTPPTLPSLHKNKSVDKRCRHPPHARLPDATLLIFYSRITLHHQPE